MKNNCCLFERLFKILNNDTFLFGVSFFCSGDINLIGIKETRIVMMKYTVQLKW